METNGHSGRILLVEDDPNFGAVLKDFLTLNGYAVVLRKDGELGLEAFHREPFDLCILDVMMPRKDGFTLARDIRSEGSNVPLIFVTAKTMKQDLLEGFRVGADDYVTKPFDSEVLLYKIRAILKRKDVNRQRITSFSIGKYDFNYDLRTISFNGDTRKLSPKESELLRMLCESKDHVLAREDALKHIWMNNNYFTGRSMDVYITKLRKYLERDPGIRIENIHGKGFRLVTMSAR